MKNPVRYWLFGSDRNSLLSIIILTILLFALGPAAFGQTEPLPLKVTWVRESETLALVQGRPAYAPDGNRFVMAGLQLSPSVELLERDDLVLTTADHRLFPCAGIGDETKYIQYCMEPSGRLERKGDKFEGSCLEISGGAYSQTSWPAENPGVAFVVPNSVPLGALELSYGVLTGAIPLSVSGPTDLSSGLSGEVKLVAETPLPDGEYKLVTVQLEVRNRDRRVFRVHRSTVRLHVPWAANEWSWWSSKTGAADMTGAAPDEKREAMPMILVPPGETHALIMSFEVPNKVDAKKCELGFFLEHTVRLADVLQSGQKN